MTHIRLGVVDRHHDAALVRVRRHVPVLDRLPGRLRAEETGPTSGDVDCRSLGRGRRVLHGDGGVGHDGLVGGRVAYLGRRLQVARRQPARVRRVPQRQLWSRRAPRPPDQILHLNNTSPVNTWTGQGGGRGEKDDIHLGLDLVPRQEGRAILDPALVDPVPLDTVVEAATSEWWDPVPLEVGDGRLDVLDRLGAMSGGNQFLRLLPHLGRRAEYVPDPERAKVTGLNNQDVSPTIHVAGLPQE